jgi:hypothetical protein
MCPMLWGLESRLGRVGCAVSPSFEVNAGFLAQPPSEPGVR